MKEADDGSTWSTTTLNVDAATSNGMRKKGTGGLLRISIIAVANKPSPDFCVGDRARTLLRFARGESRF